MKLVKFLVFLILLKTNVFVEVMGANILAFFQIPYYSHEYTFHKILKVLADRGHHLTIFGAHTFDYNNNPNVTQHVFEDSVNNYKKYYNISYIERSKLNWLQLFLQYESRAFYELTKDQIAHLEMQKIIKNSNKSYKFDLIIMEYYFSNLALLAEVYDCPIVMFEACDPPIAHHATIGNDINPMKYSDSTRFPYLHNQLSINEKINSVAYFFTYFLIFDKIFYRYYLNSISSEYPIYGIKKSPTEVLNDRLSLFVVNTSPEFGHVRPLSPNTIQIGFSHVDEPKELMNFEIKNYLDASTNGVIIMSFGSAVKTTDIGIEGVSKFLKAFNQTSYNVLWKFDDPIDPQIVPENVKLTKWMPLSDILAHPNVKIIIHHGGLLTCYEAVTRKVPQIIFPIVYDEGANSRILVSKGVAVELNVLEFNVNELTEAINMIVSPIVIQNLKVLMSNVNDKLIDRKELAVLEIEKVIINRKQSDAKFKQNSFFDFFYQYFNDVLVFISTTFLTLLYFFIFRIAKKQNC